MWLIEYNLEDVWISDDYWLDGIEAEEALDYDMKIVSVKQFDNIEVLKIHLIRKLYLLDEDSCRSLVVRIKKQLPYIPENIRDDFIVKSFLYEISLYQPTAWSK